MYFSSNSLLFSSILIDSDKSRDTMDSVYRNREKRENRCRMKEINERLTELQKMRSCFESEYNVCKKKVINNDNNDINNNNYIYNEFKILTIFYFYIYIYIYYLINFV